MLTPVQAWPLLKQAASDWVEDKAMKQAAALAYYTAFAFAPWICLSVIGRAISICGFSAIPAMCLTRIALAPGLSSRSPIVVRHRNVRHCSGAGRWASTQAWNRSIAGRGGLQSCVR